ncbi:hypothetical protein ES676_01305 [Bizionia saleffrena]|uniref:Uncharacterized protein n=1 Tax=Bizionia saleffrena TaxID=291189 RepID=A0A8H2LFF3_9FLAO|nr:hypothetical protein [Bizionia saleffrena]TYB80333.1 hypothetical protein ES676_01305 [Bizionia saleffrena]
MPKQYTFPTLFDELRNISITNLTKWKYLKRGQTKSGVIRWRNSFNEVTSSLTIKVVITGDFQYLNLNYKSNDEVYDINISLVSTHSNLGKGEIWYFICPYTGKRCRILHLIQGKFIHRTAIKGGLYTKQTYSKYFRRLDKVYGACFELDRLYEELYSKHFKKTYKGKPTKRYLSLIAKIAKAERVSVMDIKIN